MSSKYYTHFVTAGETTRTAREWCGVVELRHPIEDRKGGARELRELLADNFDVETHEVRILHWARLH
ncbi:MAG: hypothetical protein NZM12_13820 [Steroidobacteraceae bacterium]|nr:hypothetical protein [Steroidobacteraceae bacterium]MDW8258644.1 hypothetical protein [Gammaproteobacteria bacterium]